MFVRVHAPGQAPDFLDGRYSESFLSELARQIEEEIERVMAVKGLSESNIELQLVFAPGTYMEHTSESVTYRRLLLIDDASRPRDFWVKWTRLDGGAAFTVSDEVSADTVRFELGEDVPQKIREKEYRFLCSANPDKYQAAMGKKTATEWRDIIKRAIKYGILTKAEPPVYTPPVIPKAEPIIPAPVSNKDGTGEDISARLAELLELEDAPEEESEPVKEESFDSIVELARAALLKYGEDSDNGEELAVPDADEEISLFENEDEPITDEPITDEPITDELIIDEPITDEPVFDAIADGLALEDIEEPVAEEVEDEYKAEAIDEGAEEIEDIEDEIIEAEDIDLTGTVPAPIVSEPESVPRMPDEEEIRRELEEKIRLEYEMRAREMAELMAAERRRHEEELREAEEKRKRASDELQRTIEAQMQREALERDRLAEAARQAVLEQRRTELAAEREEPTSVVSVPTPVVSVPTPAPKPEPTVVKAPIETTKEPQWLEPKHARLIFRGAVPQGAISSIKSIVESTLIKEGKEHIHMHIKAYPIDGTTVGMDILKMPANERDLIVAIMKALGRGGLGITKITVE